ncbi:FHA domain-containing protein [Clostridium sp. E02]|uniref:FHA domain-containing protein n=1 Tax=Clostridium sp. E02 TaxID=2487134 RepID=UPI000F5210D9|nr:FHA domain-containing protein [Clostridium sp. E02]
MNSNKKIKIVLDLVVIIATISLCVGLNYMKYNIKWLWILSGVVGFFAVLDLFYQLIHSENNSIKEANNYINSGKPSQLILLNEQEKPIKSWDLAGKTALIIGKNSEEEVIDVDLDECEYSTFIDPQHAALNFCLDVWYLEDLGSQNGVKIKKVEDGACYIVSNRPCRLSVGDIIYIANTHLLFT